MAVRLCVVSFLGSTGIRHSVEVEAESLYEAAVVAVRRFRQDAWTERIGDATILDVEIREPSTKHAISLKQVERWLAAGTKTPAEASKKAKLKSILVMG